MNSLFVRKLGFNGFWRILILPILFLSAFCVAEEKADGGFTYHIEGIPSWVNQAELSSKLSKKGNDKGVYLKLSDRQVNLLEASQEVYSRFAVVPVAENGVKEVSEIRIVFSPQYNDLVIHSIGIHRNGKYISQLEVADIDLIRREKEIEKGVYNGVVTAFIILNDVRVGDVVDYSYTVSGSNPVLGDKYFDSVSMGWSTSSDRYNFRIIYPKKRKLTFRQHGFSEKPRKTVSGGVIEKQWTRNNVVGIEDEKEYPSWYRAFPWIEITEYRRWSEVVEWSLPLYNKDEPLSGGLLEKISAWKEAARTKEEYIEKALRFAQDDVRYFGIEYGKNSHLPSHPNEVFDRRYGDCKDKTLLLTRMLRENGIVASPALVSTKNKHALEGFLPSPGAFNHVIVNVKLNGRTFWLDPTLSYQHGNLNSIGDVVYGKALLISPESNRLTDILHDPKKNGVNIKQKYKVNEQNSSALLEYESVYVGHDAEYIRYMLAAKGLDLFSKNFLDYYSKYHVDIKVLEELGVEDDTKENRIKIFGKYQVADIYQAQEGFSYIPMLGDYIFQFTNLPEVIKRKTPFGIKYPVNVTQEVALVYPSGTDWVKNIEPTTISDESMSYQRSVSNIDNTVSVKYKYYSKQDYVSHTNIKQYVENLKTINKDLQQSLYIPAAKIGSGQRQKRLKDMLKKLRKKQGSE